MRLLFGLIFFLTTIPSFGQKFPVTWLTACTLPDSLQMTTLSSNASMDRICIMAYGEKGHRYIYVAEKTNGEWPAPALALRLKSHAMQARISADGHRIFMVKDIDEHTGESIRTLPSGVTVSDNAMGIYVSEEVEKDKWSQPHLLDDLFFFTMPTNSLSISPDEKTIFFTQLHPGAKSDKIDLTIYRTVKNSQNKWEEPKQVDVKGIVLAKRLAKNAIAGAEVIHRDNDKVLIEAYDGSYLATSKGNLFTSPVKIEYYARPIVWIDPSGSVGLIRSDGKPFHPGFVRLAPEKNSLIPTSPATASRTDSPMAKPDTTKTIRPTGKYYAVLIGVSQYANPSLNLDRPVKDVEQLRSMLVKEYTFENGTIQSLVNPTRQQIINLLFKLRQVVGKNDNLLIFYAGHGHYDNNIRQGYWWPTDAVPDDPSNWLSNSDLREQIRGIPSAHTLLISDACFSGGIFKTRGTEELSSAPLEIVALYKTQSRRAITSGSLSSVPDQSVFFDYLTRRLSDNEDKFLPSQQLFARLKPAVINNSLTIPQDGVILDAGDEGGDFIFIRRGN